jgi:hypothetical protein
MNEKDIYTNIVVLFLVNREILEKKYVPWDGMGPSRPTKSPVPQELVIY